MSGSINDALSRFQATSQNSVLPKVNATNKEKLKEAAGEFEAIFVKQMLDTMRKSLHKEDQLVDGGIGQDIFEDMLYTEYSRIMSKAGDFGIARAITNQYEKVIPKDPYGS